MTLPFTIRAATPEEAPALRGMTFPAYQHLLHEQPALPEGEALRLVAVDESGAAQALLLSWLRRGEGELLSLFVQPPSRHQGLGTALLREFMRACEERHLSRALVIYTSGKSTIPYLERILAANGWTEPRGRMLSVKTSTAKALYDPQTWCRPMSLPKGWRIIRWADVTPVQKEAVIHHQKATGEIPNDLYPPRVESLGPVDAATSVALLIGDELAGWVLTHPIDAHNLRFTAAYVMPRLQKRAWMIGLLHASISRMEGAGFLYGIWTTPLYFEEMIRFIQRRMELIAEYCRETRESSCSFDA